MASFKRYDVAGLLGLTPIASVPDSQVWSMMLTPQVRALLGDIVSVSGPHVRESVQGLFPGDEVTNLNNHRLYGGLSSDTVRFPYITTMYRTTFGALVIKRDAVKVKAMAWYGDVERGRSQLIFKSALRDRRFDGSRRANDNSLVEFPYDDPCLNAALPVGKGVEQSVYGYLPGSRITDLLGPQEREFEQFVGNPFTFLDRPELFLKHFHRAWNGSRGPGQIAAVIPDVARLIIGQLERVAIKRGYDFMENACSHYNVAMWLRAHGYRYTYQADEQTLSALSDGIAKLKAAGMQLTRTQESWVCVVQSLPVELIPQGLYLGGPTWPQNNIDQKNLWMHRPLNDNAAALLPGPLPAPAACSK